MLARKIEKRREQGSLGDDCGVDELWDGKRPDVR
jgi:hypothetical protein